MAKTTQPELDPADYIQPLYINGMNGRMLRMPARGRNKREILVLYGHHALLERWWGLVQNFNDFGAVTMPDIPGFGGMDSFYKIGQKATLDNYADYLAAFIKMRYKRRRISIVGISFGFLVTTRMLQKYPELARQVDFLISAAGFMRRDDFTFSRRRYAFFRITAKIMAVPPLPLFFRYVVLSTPVLRMAYGKTPNAKHKFAQAKDPEEFTRMMDMEIELWHKNDVRTYLATTTELLTVDNCKIRVDLPVWHVYTNNDHFFDHTIVEQHMRVVFSDFHPAVIKHLKTHTVSVLANKKEAASLIPPVLRSAIRKADKA